MKTKKIPTAAETAEKKQNRFAFTCVANILYIIPCLSCMAMAVLLEGFRAPFGLALVTMLLNLPVSIFALSRFRHKKGRSLVIAAAAVMLVLHIVCCPLVGTWYIIMAPSFILYCLMIAWSGVVQA